MKFARSSVAILSLVAVVKCVPVATNTVGLASVTQSTFPTTITLGDGSVATDNCVSVEITDLGNGTVVGTTNCSPVSVDDSSSSSSTVTLPPSSTSTAGVDDSAAGTDNGTSTTTTTSPPPAATTSVISDTGVGANIISRGTISAQDIHPDPEDPNPADIGQTKTKRYVVTSNHVTSTSDGPVSENCQIQLTPQNNGEYTEVQTCEVSIEPNNNAAAPPVAVNPSSTPEAVNPSSTTPDVVSETSVSPIAPTSSSASSTPAAPTLPASASSSGSSSDPAISTPQTSSPASNGAVNIGTALTSLSVPSASATAIGSLSSNGTNGTAAADTSSAFAMPGKQLSVLPVGLAVFAGVSVIALVVVGIVTYERTKYRKNFRRRQLAEQLKARPNQMSGSSV